MSARRSLDGVLTDDAWQAAVWQLTDHTAALLESDNDEDASYELACIADYDFIYFAFRIRDDAIYTGEATGCDVWGDDSLEIYIDGCFERAPIYDGDEASITIGADTIGIADQDEIELGGCTGPFPGPDTGSTVYAVATNDGWAGEIAIPLRFEGDDGWDLEPADGQIIGFNSAYNDDDDGGDRDSKLIWSISDRYDDQSWQNPQNFGELQFCSVI